MPQEFRRECYNYADRTDIHNETGARARSRPHELEIETIKTNESIVIVIIQFFVVFVAVAFSRHRSNKTNRGKPLFPFVSPPPAPGPTSIPPQPPITKIQELGGTSKQRLVTLAECAIKGLSIPNPVSVGEFVSSSEALEEEIRFREFLEREGVVHPEKLELGSPQAPVNRLVASERGMVVGRLSWWDWMDLRLRIVVFDSASRLAWWWNKKSSFTERDIG